MSLLRFNSAVKQDHRSLQYKLCELWLNYAMQDVATSIVAAVHLSKG